MVLSTRGYILLDDTVIDKHHSQCIGLVRQPCSGNTHGIIASIGLATCMCVNIETGQFQLIEYCLFAPDTHCKTKLDHVAEMLE